MKCVNFLAFNVAMLAYSYNHQNCIKLHPSIDTKITHYWVFIGCDIAFLFNFTKTIWMIINTNQIT